ncbi:MAG: glycosyltransferase family 4 protein [Phycisphaerales bacterium]|nr:glycosyltransferase family 4 protein [Phycisphaerales bacterium]
MTWGAPLLIALPDGLNASGVTTWAVRLASALAASGRVCGLVLHPEPPGQRPIDVALHPGVRIFDLRRLPRLDAEGGGAFAPAYLAAARSLGARPGGPVVLSPNLVGECYAVAAELTRAHADAVRTIAVHHSDLAYNDAVCAHFEPIVHAFVGVSERITDRLRRNLPARAADVHRIPYGVEASGVAAPRPPLAGRPVRLLYAGRIEHEQKRVRSLVAMSDALAARGVAHELALVGDGPACPEIDAACASRSWVRRLPPRSPAGIAALLDAADLFVLASRYEGLSVSVLEAMARGCTPVITRTASGAGEQITEGVTGFLVDADDGDDAATGDAMADAVQRAIRAGPHRAGAAAAKRARDCFSVEAWPARTPRSSTAAPPRRRAAGRRTVRSRLRPCPQTRPNGCERCWTASPVGASSSTVRDGTRPNSPKCSPSRPPASSPSATTTPPAREGRSAAFPSSRPPMPRSRARPTCSSARSCTRVRSGNAAGSTSVRACAFTASTVTPRAAKPAAASRGR